MAANALHSAHEADDAMGGRASRAPGATNQGTDDAVQASLARLSKLMESAREHVIAAARLEAAEDGHVEESADPASDGAKEIAAGPERLPTAEIAPFPLVPAPAPPAADPRPGAPRRAMSPPAAAVLDDPASVVSDRVVAATAEIEARLRAAFDNRMDELSGCLAETQARMDAAELRSLDAIEDLGRRVEETSRRASDAKVAETRGAEAVERLSAELSRISESVEAGLKQSQADQARTLEGLDEKLGWVSERLAERIGGADWRSARANEEMGETLARACERLSRDLIERIELGEGRTVAMLVQARDGIERPLAAPAEAFAEAQAPPAWRGHTAAGSPAPAPSVDIGEQAGTVGGFLPAFSTFVAQRAGSDHEATIDGPAEPDGDPQAPDAAGPAIAESPPEEMSPPPARSGFWRGFGLTRSGAGRNP